MLSAEAYKWFYKATDSSQAQDDNFIWVIPFRSPPNPLKGERHPAKTFAILYSLYFEWTALKW
jgi:hypothetical protein